MDEGKRKREAVPGVTIDAAHTRDIDDAIHVEELTGLVGRWRVRVSIADVAAAVPRDSDCDAEAYNRGATAYFATGNSPMLPRHLSEDQLSLLRGVERRTITADVVLAGDYSTVSAGMYRSRLTSAARIAHEDVPAMVAANHPVLAPAAHLAVGLLARRRDRGALALYDLNEGWLTTEEGAIRQLRDHRETIGHVIVQEMMILANEEFARFATTTGIPILYRNHEARAAAPDRVDLMRALEDALARPIQHLDRLREQVHLVLERARYAPVVRGHYGLNLPVYVHATSPIRRYADLVTQRNLGAFFDEEPYPHSREDLAVLAAYLNERMEQIDRRRGEGMKDAANRRAVHAVADRRLHGLNPKDFERVCKVEARSGAEPSPAFVAAFEQRLADDRVPLVCKTVVLAVPPMTPGWAVVRQRVIDDLARHPWDAPSIAMQATQIAAWPAAEVKEDWQGPDHARQFFAIATIGDARGQAPGIVAKEARQLAILAAIAVRVGIEPPLFERQPSGGIAALPSTSPAAMGGGGKNPVSVLMERSQRDRAPAPGFTFKTEGPDHMPTIRCEATYRPDAGGMEYRTSAVAGGKREARRRAAAALLELLGGV